MTQVSRISWSAFITIPDIFVVVECSVDRISLSKELLAFSTTAFSVMTVDSVGAVNVAVDVDDVELTEDIDISWLLSVELSDDDSMMYVGSVESDTELSSVSLEVDRRRLPNEWTPLLQRI